MPFIIPANTLASGGFDVDNSGRFNIGSSDHLTRSLGGSPTSTRKATWSYWVKRSTLTSSASEMIYSNEVADDNNRGFIQFEDNDSFRMTDSVSSTQLKTNRLFRDVASFYHIVLAIDTTQGTAANRIKLYVNGVQETSFATASYPDQNDDLKILTGGQTNKQHISKVHGGSGYFGGYLSEFVFIDGLQLAPTSFGEFEEDSGIWVPIDVSGLTFGTNGFYLDFEDSSALGNDANGGTDFTVNNLTAADQSTDTCTNNFATLNSLNNYWAAATFSEGNLVYTSNNTGDYYGISPSTIGVSKGKWYFEAKTSTASGQDILGITSRNMTGRTTWLGSRSQEYGYYQDNGEIRSNAGGGGSDTSYGQTYTVNDIIGIYMDLDNNLMYVSDNGSLMNSGAGHTITAAASTDSGFYHFAVGDNSDSTQVWQCNFGGTSGFAISSAVADDNGFGAFEYSPNITGDSVAKKFYSLCTKNLAEFG